MNEQKYLFRLYIADHQPHSRQIAKDLAAVLERYYPGQYEVETIDVLVDVQAALQNDIFATPTLVREEPVPVSRIMGDLSDISAVLIKMGVIRK